MAMAAFSRTSFTAASPFRFSVIRSHYTVNSTGNMIMRSLIAHPNNQKSISMYPSCNTNTMLLGGNRANSNPKTSLSSPWLMLPPTFDSSKNMVYQFYSLADDKVVSLNKKNMSEEEIPDDKSAIVGSSHGWLALFNRQNCDLFLSNPITRRHIKLPPIHNLPDIPQENLDGGYGCVNNVVISSSDPENDDCRAMIAYGPTDDLAFCCPSRRSTDWSLLRGCSSVLAYSIKRNLFLCECRLAHEDIVAWDLRDPLSPSMTPIARRARNVYYRSEKELELKRLCGLHFQFLVVKEGSDELFHVKKYVLHRVGPDGSFVDDAFYGSSSRGGGYDDDNVPYKTVGFDVHKYDPETGSLVYMDGNLGGLALFVGPNDGGFALSPDEFPELKPNSIYYTDSAALPEYCDQPYGGYDVGIFDYENATFSSCYYPCGLKSIFTKIQPIPRWFTPTG